MLDCVGELCDVRQEFNFEIEHCTGLQNKVAYAPSIKPLRMGKKKCRVKTIAVQVSLFWDAEYYREEKN